MTVEARAPGRVNLIGDHTDYTGGLVLPMAIDRWTTVRGERFGDVVALRSEHEPLDVEVPLDVVDPAGVDPPWGRYVAGVVAEARPPFGLSGRVASTVPVGAGLSSSAALEVAVALALGVEGSPLAIAGLCQRAEQRASGVPCGIMDQLASVAGVEGAALLIDCHTLDVRSVPLPPTTEAEVVVVHSGVTRSLAGSAYAERARQCANAERIIGRLRAATLDDVERISHPIVRARARHVITENERVGRFAAALVAGDLDAAGALMLASHASLRDDFEVSTPELDDLVARLSAVPGVFGARLTGAGFGGCVVALARPGVVQEGWVVRPVAGASVTVSSRDERVSGRLPAGYAARSATRRTDVYMATKKKMAQDLRDAGLRKKSAWGLAEAADQAHSGDRAARSARRQAVDGASRRHLGRCSLRQATQEGAGQEGHRQEATSKKAPAKKTTARKPTSKKGGEQRVGARA